MGSQGQAEIDLEGCAAGLVGRMRAQQRAAAARAATLRTFAERAAALLVDAYGARRVWLFGSLAAGMPHAESDIDLLVEGLSAQTWALASAALEDAVDAPVDLVRAEDAVEGLLARVREEGIVLRESV
jgi:predicted nucleotidyltransferase